VPGRATTIVRQNGGVPDRPTVSVVIPTYNRRERLARVLQALAAQRVKDPFEVVVVSDGSTDGTDDYLEGPTPLPVRAERQPNSGPAVARNRGVQVASGELIVFLDDDVVPDPGLIAAHVAAHERLGEHVVVIGPMLNPPDHRFAPWVRWEQAMLAKQYAAMERGDWAPTARQFYTGNASVRRAHVLAAGGFNPSYRRAEDLELAFRLAAAGLTFAFEPAAIGLHYAERSYEAWRAVAEAYGRNAVVMARDQDDELLELAAVEFHERHPLLRALTKGCLGRPRCSTVVERCLRALAVGADRVGVHSVAQQALSGIYGLVYCQGIADELGGVDAWWRRVDAAVPVAADR